MHLRCGHVACNSVPSSLQVYKAKLTALSVTAYAERGQMGYPFIDEAVKHCFQCCSRVTQVISTRRLACTKIPRIRAVHLSGRPGKIADTCNCVSNVVTCYTQNPTSHGCSPGRGATPLGIDYRLRQSTVRGLTGLAYVEVAWSTPFALNLYLLSHLLLCQSHEWSFACVVLEQFLFICS